MSEPKRMGRPPKPAGQVKDHSVAFRVNEGMIERLRDAAASNHRSVAGEIEYRLEASFRASPATLEQVRTIIDEAVRAALREASEVPHSSSIGPHHHGRVDGRPLRLD